MNVQFTSCVQGIMALTMQEHRRFCICRSSQPKVFFKKGVLRNVVKFTGKHLCQSQQSCKRQACSFFKKETLTQVFFFEFCKVSKKAFSQRTPPVAASVYALQAQVWFHGDRRQILLLLLREYEKEYIVDCKQYFQLSQF